MTAMIEIAKGDMALLPLLPDSTFSLEAGTEGDGLDERVGTGMA